MDDILASIRRIIAEEEPHLSDAPEPAPPRHSELQGQRPESTAVPGEAPRAGREAAPGAERTADATAPARGSMSAPARPLPPGGEAAPVRTHTRVPPLPAATELPGRDASAGGPRSERPPLPPRTPLSGPPMPDTLRAALLDHMAGSTIHAPGSSELGPDFTTQLENALLEVGMADSTPSHDPAESSRPPVRPVAPVREVGKRKDLLSPEVEGAVASAFESLGAALLPAHGRTMEDLVKEILRPMLKSWLDDNLPRIVERLVRQEIERISRSSR